MGQVFISQNVTIDSWVYQYLYKVKSSGPKLQIFSHKEIHSLVVSPKSASATFLLFLKNKISEKGNKATDNMMQFVHVNSVIKARDWRLKKVMVYLLNGLQGIN